MTIQAPESDYTRGSAEPLLNVARAESVLAEAGVDLLIATGPENVAYVSGYYCHTHWSNKGTLAFGLLPRAAAPEPTVIAPALELDAWAETPPAVGTIALYGTSSLQIGRELASDPDALLPDDRFIYEHGFQDERHDDALTVLASHVRNGGYERARIALDETGLRYRDRERVAALFPDATIVDGAPLLRRIRMVKTEAEVRRLEQATLLTCRALASTMAIVEEGVTERELLLHYNEQIAAGGGLLSFAAISAGRRSGHPHPAASDYRLKAGDVIKYDVGCIYELYHADIGRTQTVGEPSTEQEAVYRALETGEQAGIAAVRPGARPSEIFGAALAAVREHGMPGYRRHHVGHGIGIEIYDPPLIQPATSSSELSGLGASDEPIEEGMVLNVETPYYVLGKHGMIVEDTILVTADGFRYLTDLPRSLTYAGS
jgi:Xaa-Pro aminopeptidase